MQSLSASKSSGKKARKPMEEGEGPSNLL